MSASGVTEATSGPSPLASMIESNLRSKCISGTVVINDDAWYPSFEAVILKKVFYGDLLSPLTASSTGSTHTVHLSIYLDMYSNIFTYLL